MRSALPLLALVLLLLLPACSAPRRAPVPAELASRADIAGIPHARFWGDEVTPVLVEWIEAGLRRERAFLKLNAGQPLPDTAFLCGLLALGEGWHNNHHAFPTSARHGLKWWQLDVSYLVIRALALLGLARSPRALPRAHRSRTPRPLIKSFAPDGLCHHDG